MTRVENPSSLIGGLGFQFQVQVNWLQFILGQAIRAQDLSFSSFRKFSTLQSQASSKELQTQ